MPELAYCYQRLGWGGINLDFSGTMPAGHALHHDIAALAVGSPLVLGQERIDNWMLRNAHGAVVGKLSRSFKPPKDMHCIAARVIAIHVRSIKDVGDEHKARISDQCTSWEMVVPELIFLPDGLSGEACKTPDAPKPS